MKKTVRLVDHDEAQRIKRENTRKNFELETSKKPLATFNTYERAKKLHPVPHKVYDAIMAKANAKKMMAQKAKQQQLDQEMHRKIQNMDSPNVQKDDKGLDFD